VWIPSSATPRTSNLAVMVFIHGGGFYLGSGADATYDGSKLSAQQNVIIVTMNYRLSILGLLSLKSLIDESNTGGSYALADQQSALRWVQRNILQFGGDPQRVMLFGQSAGQYVMRLQP